MQNPLFNLLYINNEKYNKISNDLSKHVYSVEFLQKEEQCQVKSMSMCEINRKKTFETYFQRNSSSKSIIDLSCAVKKN